ncbi:glycosyltransferase family 2 protein [Silvimonas amylolytica]|uniref:Glycosyl transferase family 2 n=1 Tax=Silvimonas amylolytica TaxID=449663 RepID=A0ABQ2PLT0_9NEIS|nr:glycosyltransferase family 2 protein [Silvimonas amylolytica]GGP26238.1 glycosyl transferase family 2 [Silvimonas amylolytica]
MRLSVILIAHNEIANLRDCLASVAFADEVIVVDSGSTDGSVALAREMGAKVLETDWPGFGPQKNRALDLAQGDWVFSIDADERVPEGLRDEILMTISQPQFDAYEMPRLSSFCGRFIRHSGWWPDPVLRLFRRGSARFTDVAVHERLIAQGKTGRLRHHLLHYSYPDLESVLAKINRYSSDAARAKFAAGKRSTLLGACFRGFWTFFRHYTFQRGFLDGREGFLLAVTAGIGNFCRYAKLAQLGRNEAKS